MARNTSCIGIYIKPKPANSAAMYEEAPAILYWIHPDKPEAAPASFGLILTTFAIIFGITMPFEYVTIIIVPKIIYIFRIPLISRNNIIVEPKIAPKTANDIILREPTLSDNLAVVKLPDINAKDININVKP